MFSATFEGTSRIVLVVARPVVALLRSLEALGQEREELFRGPKSQLTAGVHFLDPALEPLVRFAIWAELQDERPSHHEVSVRR
jgi:hypothetical protein